MVDQKIWLLKGTPFEKIYKGTSKIDLHYLEDGIVLKCVNGIQHGQKYIKMFDEYTEIDIVSYIEYFARKQKSVQKFKYELEHCYYEVYPKNMLVIGYGELPLEWQKLILLDITNLKQFRDENLAF